MKRALILSCILLLAACGKDDNNANGDPNNANNANNANNENNENNASNNASNNENNASNNGSNNANNTNNASNNPTNNVTTPDNSTNLPPLNNANPGMEVTESEPNDEVATATVFEPNDTLIGNTSDNDNDFWAIDLVAGSVLEVELTSVQLVGAMYVDLIDPADAVPERTVGGNEGDTRQFFIPTSGTYVLRLTDLTAGFSDYEITTRVLEPTVIDTYDPPGFVDGDLNDYAVDIYAYTAGANESVRAGVTADRSPVLSDMDAMMIVFQPGRGLVEVNDDLDNMTVDPEVTYDQVNGTTYWLVVDAVYLEPGGDNSYTLGSEFQ